MCLLLVDPFIARARPDHPHGHGTNSHRQGLPLSRLQFSRSLTNPPYRLRMSRCLDAASKSAVPSISRRITSSSSIHPHPLLPTPPPHPTANPHGHENSGSPIPSFTHVLSAPAPPPPDNPVLSDCAVVISRLPVSISTMTGRQGMSTTVSAPGPAS